MSSQPSPYNLFSFCCCCCYRWQHGIVFGVWIRNSLHVMYSLGWCSSTHFSQHHERARQPHRYIHESCTCIESAIDGGLVALSCAADEMHNRHVELEGRMARDMSRVQGNQLFPIRINSIETKLYFPLLTLNCVDVLFCWFVLSLLLTVFKPLNSLANVVRFLFVSPRPSGRRMEINKYYNLSFII